MSAGVAPGAAAHGFGRASHRPGSRASFKVRGVEGWRGVACLVVVAYHVWQNMDLDGDGLGPVGGSNGPLGAILSVDLVVDLFFVLSGLLLFLPFAHAALDVERAVPSRREFLWRRCLRLFPVYWALVVLCWSTRNFGLATAQWRDLVEHLLLLQSFDSERIFYTIGPAWTLSIEWVFYLALAALGPVVARWVRRHPGTGGRVARMLGALGVVALLSVLFKLDVQWVWRIPVTDWAWRFGPAAKADDFALGMALAVIVVAAGRRRAPVPLTLLLLAGGVALLWTARVQVGADPDAVLVVLRHPVAALGWSLVLAAVTTARSDRPAAWIDNRLAVRLSILAYTVYLVHEPVILWAVDLGLLSPEPRRYALNLLVVAVATLLAAWVLHRVVEEPWVDLGALQARGGGRRDLYADVRATGAAPLAPVGPAGPVGPVGPVAARDLRSRVLAARGVADPALLVVGVAGGPDGAEGDR